MRNLKRALSLALASVMLLGMMVVGTSASYPDVDAQDNLEAIEVMQLIGVMDGDDKGNFNPDQKVTRNQMAVVMTHLMNLNLGGTTPFTDVPGWAEPFVAACYENGVVAGTSATTYGGNQNVTAAQAALMVMKALGYFGYAGEFGDDWQLATVKQAAKINLFDGINAAVTAPLTRNEVAKLVLNALQADVVIVEEKGGVDVDADNVSVVVKPDYDYYLVDSSVDYIQGTGGDNHQQLAEKLFGAKLKLFPNGGADDFGRPTTKWSYRGESVTSPKAADATYTAEVKASTIYTDLGMNTADADAVVYTNGTANQTAGNIAKDEKDNKWGGNGTLVEVYASEDIDGKIDVTVVVINTFANKVTKAVAAKGDDAAYVLVNGMKYETESFAKDDVVLYTKAQAAGKDAYAIKSMKLAEKVADAEITKVTVGSSFVADGTTYEYSATVTADDKLVKGDVDSIQNLYLDDEGFVIFAEPVTVATDYAYVLNAGMDADRYGDNTYYAKLLLSDATVAEVKLDADKMNLDSKRDVDAFKGDVVEYSKDSKDVYTLTTKGDGTTEDQDVAIKNGEAKMTLGAKTYYANAKTLFLVQTGDKYAAYVGYANVPNLKSDDKASISVAGTENGIAKVVFVKDASSNEAAKDIVYVLATDAPKEIKDTAAGIYYQYKAVVNGEITTIDLDETVAENTLFSSMVYNDYDIADVELCDKYTTTGDNRAVTTEVVEAPADGVIGVTGETFALAEDVEVYKVSTDKIEVAELEDLVATSDIVMVVNNGEVTAIFWTPAP